MDKVPNGIESLPKISIAMSRAHQGYRQTGRRQMTDGRSHSERKLEFTFAKT